MTSNGTNKVNAFDLYAMQGNEKKAIQNPSKACKQRTSTRGAKSNSFEAIFHCADDDGRKQEVKIERQNPVLSDKQRDDVKASSQSVVDSGASKEETEAKHLAEVDQDVEKATSAVEKCDEKGTRNPEEKSVAAEEFAENHGMCADATQLLLVAQNVQIAMQQEVVPTSLDALLPQDAVKNAQALQNQQLMDMLSGNSANVVTPDMFVADGNAQTQVLTTEKLADMGSVVSSEAVENLSQMVKPAQDTSALPEVSAGLTDTVMDSPLLKQADAIPLETQQVMQTTDVTIAQSSAAVEDGVAMKTAQLPDALRSEATKAQITDSMWRGMRVVVEDQTMPQTGAGQENPSDLMQQHAGQSGATKDASLPEGIGAYAQAENRAETFTIDATQANAGLEVVDVNLDGVGGMITPLSEFMPATGAQDAGIPTQGVSPRQVVEQIVDQARLLRTTENAEMVIRLKPQHLGELTLRIAVSAEGTVTASFHTDNPQTKGLLETSALQLKQELQAQGIKVDTIDVHSGLSEDFFANSQAGQQGQPGQQAQVHNARLEHNAYEDDVTLETDSTMSASDGASVDAKDGVDYRV